METLFCNPNSPFIIECVAILHKRIMMIKTVLPEDQESME